MTSAQVEIAVVDLRRPARSEVLGEVERARAAGFRFDRDRRRYVAAHAALREVLALRVGECAASLVFEKGPFGKPRLTGGAPEFSLSHSGEVAVIAVAGVPVGVDVERHRRLAFDELARKFFSLAEATALAAVPPGTPKEEAFFACWTRKEAYLKAIGASHPAPLDSFEVAVGPGSLAVLRAARHRGAEVGRWILRDVPVPRGYSSCVAAATDS